MKKATIKDVSEVSGFSISTISRVLNGNYPVKQETKDKILKVISDLNFSRNTSARNLRTQKSNIVGLVVADINNPYYSSIAKKLDDGLFKSDYNLLVCNTDESETKEQQILTALSDKGVDAIVISPVAKDIDFLRKLNDSGINIIIIDRNIGLMNLPFIGSDNFAEAKQLTEFLINQGHQKIAFVSGTPTAITSQDRLYGYRAALVENNLQFTDENLIEGFYLKEKAYPNILHFLKKNLTVAEPFTAIFSSNNLMTASVIKATNELNLKIPEDISLVSFGELDSQEIIEPKVTCIKQNIDQIADRILTNILSLSSKNQINETGNLIADTLEIGNSVNSPRSEGLKDL